jgi:hypothetical protein
MKDYSVDGYDGGKLLISPNWDNNYRFSDYPDKICFSIKEEIIKTGAISLTVNDVEEVINYLKNVIEYIKEEETNGNVYEDDHFS